MLGCVQLEKRDSESCPRGVETGSWGSKPQGQDSGAAVKVRSPKWVLWHQDGRGWRLEELERWKGVGSNSVKMHQGAFLFRKAGARVQCTVIIVYASIRNYLSFETPDASASWSWWVSQSTNLSEATVGSCSWMPGPSGALANLCLVTTSQANLPFSLPGVSSSEEPFLPLLWSGPTAWDCRLCSAPWSLGSCVPAQNSPLWLA